MEMIDNVIAKIRTHNVIVGDELAMLANDFDYDAILSLM
jgi:hypothetical protein